jgi:hypothetical protein
MRAFLCVLAAGAMAVAVSVPASASFVVTFSYNGSATVGGVTSNVTTTQDVNNAVRFFSTPDPDSLETRDRASLINYADTDPFVFAAGGAVGGTADADATLTVKVDITNDSGAAAEFLWSGLIFAGGVGFAVPDYSNDNCLFSAIESCQSYLATPFSILAGEEASLRFFASIAGTDLFSGDILVNNAGAVSNFAGIALNGFGPAAGNPNFLDWDETNFLLSLGVFAAGETRTLEFTIIASASTLRSFCDSSTDPDCLLAMAGFGDPPGGGSSGGVSQNSGDTTHSIAFSFIGPAAEIPLPPAAFLFLAGLAGLAARGRIPPRR